MSRGPSTDSVYLSRSTSWSNDGFAALRTTSMNFNKAGRPILTDSEIEQKAYILLAQYKPNCLHRPGIAPIARILTDLNEKRGVIIEPASLGDVQGYKIRGAITFHPRPKISIARDIFEEAGPTFMFTAAHEIGHWVLHRHRRLKLEDVRESVCRLDDTDGQLDFPRRLETERDWIEHQANHFAACLLMPRRAVELAILEKQKEMGITRNVGIIYLDEREDWSQRDYRAVVYHLQNVLGTSRTAIGYRLEKLALVKSAGNETSKTALPRHFNRSSRSMSGEIVNAVW